MPPLLNLLREFHVALEEPRRFGVQSGTDTTRARRQMARESEEGDGNVRMMRILKRSSRREGERWEKRSKRRKKSTNLRLLAPVCQAEGNVSVPWQGFGLNDLQRTLPALTILGFRGSVKQPQIQPACRALRV